MKINKEKVKERLAGVPDKNQSHIYDATIIIEFLNETLMPTKFFLPPNFKPTPGLPLGARSMRAVSRENNIQLSRLYEMYLMFREYKDYTSKIESRYIFGVIVRNLRYYRNHWEFVVYRVGVAQIWHIGPVKLRVDVPADLRDQFLNTAAGLTVEEITVEADPVAEDEQEEEDRFKEAIGDRFVEVKEEPEGY